MKHIIMSTAGHIDHGKTALIKALTNFDCDTYKEEKERGITINLGFTYLDLENGNSVGIVDVPGHKDFVNTMIAGVNSIDLVLLVIAADKGVMPQTIEHLKILELLGVKYGFIALTKIDLVEKDLVKIAKEEIKEFVKGTFLEDSPIIFTSIKTEEGLHEIKNYIATIVNTITKVESYDFFRMYVDRVFTFHGFGTVLNGSVMSGRLDKNKKIYLLPPIKELRIRRLEHHGKKVEEVFVGDRASINVTGLSKNELEKGMVISDIKIKPTNIIDAKITLFNTEKYLKRWSQINFLIGTYQEQVRIHLLDKKIVKGGESAFVQIHLPKDCITLYGDKFILRSSSGDVTIGGGLLLDAHPLHHKRKSKKVVDQLKKVASKGIQELIMLEIRKTMKPLSLRELSEILKLPLNQINKFLVKELPGDIILIAANEKKYVMKKNYKEDLQNKIVKNLKIYHKKNPLIENGLSFGELLGILGKRYTDKVRDVLKIILDNLAQKKVIKKSGKTWSLFEHNVSLNQKDKAKIKLVEEYLLKSGLKTLLLSQLIAYAKKEKIDEKKLQHILKYLLDKEKIYYIDGYYLHSKPVDSCKSILLEYLEKNREGITVAKFRDLIKGNRKISLLLLSHFDNEGITIRKGDYRRLKNNKS